MDSKQNYPWIDKSTGINPFESISNHIHPFLYFFRIIIALLKLPIFVICFSLSFLYFLLAMMIPSSNIKSTFIKINSKIFCRIFLLLMGNISILEIPTPLVDTFADSGEVRSINPGDIIFTNFGSYLNMFWLQMKYAPYFVIPHDSKSVEVHSFFIGFLRILKGFQTNNHPYFTLNEIIEKAKDDQCPIVIFPEGIPTNGTGILEFIEFDNQVNWENVNFHVFGFKHRSFGLSPNFTSGNGLFHLFSMLGRSMAGMNVKIALPQDVPEFNKYNTKEWLSQIRKVMGEIMRIPLLSVNRDAAEKYYKHINLVKVHND